MNRLLALGLIIGLFAVCLPLLAADGDKKAALEALKELNDFVGEFKGEGGPDKPGARPAPRDTWSEKIAWGWKFKGDDACLTLEIADGRHLKSGEIRYLPDRKKYQLVATTKDDKKLTFEGELSKGYLTFERVDDKTKETQQVVMNSAAEGVRFIYRYGTKAEGSTVLKKEYWVQATRAGESLAAKEKMRECIVTGGLGTMPVMHKGETYYVCCSGCRDAFNENPEKYIREWKAKKNK